MYKLIILEVVAMIISYGCSVSKRAGREITALSQIDSKKALQLTEKQNITNSSFFIERGKISTSGEGGRINLLFTMKYTQPGKYLISLKSTTGIEALRVYLTEDTVLINDRIKLVTLYGKPFDFAKIAGLPAALLKVSVGDLFITDKNKEIPQKCIDNSLTITDYFQGLIIKSIIDCKIGKTKNVILTSGIPNELISIFYSKHKQDGYEIPGRIEVNDFRRKVKIVIRIEKYYVPWFGEMIFIPGSGYKLRKLL